MSAVRKAVVFLLLAFPAIVESQAFEAISLKPARSGDPRTMRLRALPNGDLIAMAVPVPLLLHYAHDVPVNRAAHRAPGRRRLFSVISSPSP
jgi:hypothetical protein